jgi:hypothetical protein
MLHDDVRQPIERRACIEEPGDVRMLETREDLPLGAEATQDSSVSVPRFKILIATCFLNSRSARCAR